ncbi:MAG: energy transducer TonB [Terriglobia bacterium]
MFEDTLLESSFRQTSVLRRTHYIFSAFAGALFFAQGLYLLPMLLAPPDRRALFIAAAMLGVVAAIFTLMLCYVWADARQQHLHAWPWLAITLVLNVPGYLIYMIYSAQKTGNWKRAAIPLAYVAESILVGVLILVPLIYTQALPSQWLITPLHIPPPPGRPPGPPPGPQVRPLVHHTPIDGLTAPPIIPTTIERIVDHPQPPQQEGLGPGVIGAIPGGPSDGPINSVLESLIVGNGPPPPPPAHVATKPQMVRRGGNVIAARALYQPPPVYPPLAIAARIQGTVVLQAILGTDGRVQDLKVMSGHPWLARAAIEAVKSWRYQPTLLNSEPVEVLTEIDVNFRLGE